MDEVDRLIEAFRARATSSVRSKTDVLLDLERLSDPRVVPFLLDVLANQREATPVRIHVLRRLRNGNLAAVNKAAIANVNVRIASDRSNPDVRMQAVLALAEFTDISGVAPALGRLALDLDEPIDFRFSAFTSLQRAGPTAESVAVVRKLLMDDAFGPSARHVLSLWRLG